MKFGLHVSVAGGVDKAPQRAAELGCDCFQIFVSNPRSWKFPDISEQTAASFIEAREKLKLGPVTVHATYLPNLASPEPELFGKSLNHIRAQYEAASQIGAEYFVLHPGSSKGKPLEDGVESIARALVDVVDSVQSGPMFLLENTAGGGSSIGADCAQLGALYRASGLGDDKIGVCLDTCHAWAAGYDLSGRGAFQRLISSCEDELYAGCVKLVHLNDSLFGCGQGRDRHAHIGLGEIAEGGMRNVLRAGGMKSMAVVLETPVNEIRGDMDNLAAARKLAGVL